MAVRLEILEIVAVVLVILTLMDRASLHRLTSCSLALSDSFRSVQLSRIQFVSNIIYLL